MDGRAVLRWVKFLSGAYCENVPGAAVNVGALHAYESLDGVPDSVVRAAIAAPDEDEARALIQVRLGHVNITAEPVAARRWTHDVVFRIPVSVARNSATLALGTYLLARPTGPTAPLSPTTTSTTPLVE